jgi:hypothetical protein
VIKVLNDPKAGLVSLELLTACAEDVQQFLRPFWVFSAALRLFFERHQQLPLSGTLPDMTSHTAPYVQLQSIFRSFTRSLFSLSVLCVWFSRKKAAEDAAEVFEIAKEVYRQRQALVKQVTHNAAAKSMGSLFEEGTRMSVTSDHFPQQDERMQVDQEMPSLVNESDTESNGSSGPVSSNFTEAQCQRFCKNASKIAVQNGVSLGSEYEQGLEVSFFVEVRAHSFFPIVFNVLNLEYPEADNRS